MNRFYGWFVLFRFLFVYVVPFYKFNYKKDKKNTYCY